MNDSRWMQSWLAGLAVVAAPVLLWFAPATASAQQCTVSDRTYPPGAPAVNLMPSHKIISSKQTSKWFKNSTKSAVTEYVTAGNCPEDTSLYANGRSCSPKRGCGAGKVCGSGYRAWASCPEDAGPVEWDDRPYNDNTEDPEEGPSTFNDSQDTGEQGPCFCWDDKVSKLDQRPCSTSADCRAAKMCVNGRCRCPQFDWDDCDTLRFGLTPYDENGCSSNTDEYTNTMVEEMEEEETSLGGMDVRDEINNFQGKGSAENYCGLETAYRPMADALLEFQREEKFNPTETKKERWWTRAHINMIYIRNLPTQLESGSIVKEDAIKDALVRAYKLLDGKAPESGGSTVRQVPPILTYVIHYSNPDSPGGKCEIDGDRLEIFSGMLAAVGGTGRCCYDANTDGDCVDSNDVSLSSIGTPTDLYNFIKPKSPSTLYQEILDGKYRCGVSIDEAADTSEPEYAYTRTRTEPGDTGSVGACKKGGLQCQLGGPESGGSCGNNYLGQSDIFADAACVRSLPKDRTFSEMNYEYCEKESDGTETCMDLTTSDVTFLDPNDKIFRVDESIGAQGECVGYFSQNRCPNVGDLCTTDDGCTQGVIKCVDGEEVCSLPEAPLPDETSCDGKDNDCDGVIDEGIAIVGEAGTTGDLTDDTWKSTSLSAPYASTPIAFATTQTDNDSQEPSQAHVRGVSSSGFETQHCEVDVGSPSTCDSHPAETNAWLTIDPGVLAGYKGIDAGTFESNSGTEVHQEATFNYIFESKPLVFSTVQTANESDVPRNVHPYHVQREGARFEICEQGSEHGCAEHGSETIGWLAVNPQVNDLNGVEVGQFDTGDGTGNWTTVTFTEDFENPPVVMAEVQTENGGQEAIYPEVRNVSKDQADIRFCEYGADDNCDWHLSERVAWLAVAPGEVTAGDRATCDTGKDGRCSLGACTVGPSVACKQLKQPVPEVCNGLDEDCDGTVDNIATSWEKDWNVDTTEKAHELACAKTSACSCREASDRDDQYRGGRISLDESVSNISTDDEFDEMASETNAENNDGDTDYATRCRCSE